MSPIPLGILASAGGAAPAFELISTQVLASDAASVTFSSIPATFKHLQIRATSKSNYPFGNLQDVDLNFNGDTSAVYSMHSLNGSGSAVGSTAAFSQTKIRFAEMQPQGSADNIFAGYVVDILDYASTSKNTTVRALRGALQSDSRVNLTSGLFQNTAAVSSLVFTSVTGQFKTGSRFSLYGIKG